MTRIYIAGHRGMVGGAILRRLQARKDAGEDLTLLTRTHAEMDLTSQLAVWLFLPPPRAAVSMPTTPIQLILFTKT